MLIITAHASIPQLMFLLHFPLFRDVGGACILQQGRTISRSHHKYSAVSFSLVLRVVFIFNCFYNAFTWYDSCGVALKVFKITFDARERCELDGVDQHVSSNSFLLLGVSTGEVFMQYPSSFLYF